MTQEQEEAALVAWVNEVDLPGKLDIDSLSDLSDGEILIQLAAYFVPALGDTAKMLGSSNAKCRLLLLGDRLTDSQFLTTRANSERKLLEAIMFGAVQGPYKDEAIQCMLQLSPTNQSVFMDILESFMEGGDMVGHAQSMATRRRPGGNHFSGMHVDESTMREMYIEIHELSQEMDNAEKRSDSCHRFQRTEQDTLTKITEHLSSVSDASIRCNEELRDQKHRYERLHDKLNDMKKELNDAKMNLQHGNSCHEATYLHIMELQKSVDDKHQQCNNFRDRREKWEARMQNLNDKKDRTCWKRAATRANMGRLKENIQTYDRQLALVEEARDAASKKTAALEAKLKEAQQQLEIQSQLLTDDIAKTEARQERFNQMEDELEKVFYDLKVVTYDNVDDLQVEIRTMERLSLTTEQECERQTEELKSFESKLASLQGLLLEHTRRRSLEESSNNSHSKEHLLLSNIEVHPKSDSGKVKGDASIHSPKANDMQACVDRKVLAEKHKLLEVMSKSQATLNLAQQDARTLRDELSQVGTSLKNESTVHESINQHIQKSQQTRQQILEQTRALEQAAREQATKFSLQRQMFEESLVELMQAISTESRCASQVAELSVACEGTDDVTDDDEQGVDSQRSVAATDDVDQQQLDFVGHQQVAAQMQQVKEDTSVEATADIEPKQSGFGCQSSVTKEAVSDVEQTNANRVGQEPCDAAQVQQGQQSATTQGMSTPVLDQHEQKKPSTQEVSPDRPASKATSATSFGGLEGSDVPQGPEHVQPPKVTSVNRVSPTVMRSARTNKGHKARAAQEPPPASIEDLKSQICLREKQLANMEASAGAAETRHQREAHLLAAMLHKVGMRYGRLLEQCEALSDETAEAKAIRKQEEIAEAQAKHKQEEIAEAKAKRKQEEMAEAKEKHKQEEMAEAEAKRKREAAAKEDKAAKSWSWW